MSGEVELNTVPHSKAITNAELEPEGLESFNGISIFYQVRLRLGYLLH